MKTPSWTECGLVPDHYKELIVDSGIDFDVAEQRGYLSVLRPHGENADFDPVVRKLGFGKGVLDSERAASWPALFLPSYGPSGKLNGGQLKLHSPRKTEGGKERKYESPTGRGVQLDVHPMHRDKVVDPTVPLWITEGVKKADSLTSRLREKAAVVALSGVFNWRSKVRTLGDWEDIALKGREVTICFDADVVINPQISMAMARLGNWLIARGAEKVWYVAPPMEREGKPTKGADDFFVAGGSIDDLIALRQSRALRGKVDDSFTDLTLAHLFVMEEGVDSLYYTSVGWRSWNGRRWSAISDEQVLDRIGDWFDKKLQRAVEDARRGKADLIKDWVSVRGTSKASNVMRWLKANTYISIEEFDTDPDLLNTPSGVVDLRTGALMDHSPAFMMTRCTMTPYRPGAHEGQAATDWLKALQALPEETIPWFQVRMGQAVTGHMDPTARLLVLQSDGNSGKSTVMFGLKNVLGDYAIQMDDGVLLQRDSARASSASPEMMMLRGARFAYMDETPEAATLNDVRLKKISGTPEITARDLFKPTVTFKNSLTIMLATNFPPKVARADRGTWRRLALLKFPYTYAVPGKDLHLPNRRDEDFGLDDRIRLDPQTHEAILSWIVQGSIAWYADGGAQAVGGGILNALPAVVMRDTEGWRMETDHVSRFIVERIAFESGHWVPVAELYQAYVQMLELDHGRPLGKIEFGRRFNNNDRCRSAGVEAKSLYTSSGTVPDGEYAGRLPIPPIGMNRCWVGVKLSAPSG